MSFHLLALVFSHAIIKSQVDIFFWLYPLLLDAQKDLI